MARRIVWSRFTFFEIFKAATSLVKVAIRSSSALFGSAAEAIEARRAAISALVARGFLGVPGTFETRGGGTASPASSFNFTSSALLAAFIS